MSDNHPDTSPDRDNEARASRPESREGEYVVDKTEYHALMTEALSDKETGSEPELVKAGPRTVPAFSRPKVVSRARPAKIEFGNKRLLMVAASVAGISILLKVYLYLTATPALTPDTAEAQRRARFGADYPIVENTTKVLSPFESFDGPRDPMYQSAVNRYNDTMDEVGGESDPEQYIDTELFTSMDQSFVLNKR